VRVAIATVVVLASIAIGSYGLWLIATVDREFQPRGSVGVACTAVAAALLAVSALTLRRR
jgi:threonine/homoserine efflux transporter RhtA